MALPANIQRVFDLLVQSGEPMGVAELVAALQGSGIVIAEDHLRKLPERFPDSFRSAGDDQLEAVYFAKPGDGAVDEPEQTDGDDERDEPWWAEPAPLPPLSLASVAVIDIETTGLDRELHDIWQIAGANLDTGEMLVLDVVADGHPHPDGATPLSLGEALSRLVAWLAPYEAVCGHGLRRFDLPFLAHAAEKAEVAWNPPTEILDVHQLSLLVDPTLEGRSLIELARWLDIDHDTPHLASADVVATAAVAHEMLARFDTTDPSFALAHRLMAEGANPWARLIEAGKVDPDLGSVLTAAADPLAVAATPMVAGSARVSCDRGYQALSSGEGYRDRPTQREMSDHVAEVFDDGGRLLVEAPTGTGKSLAYLIPAAGRAVAAPVVIATHTKVLQRQLRGDAERLRELGVLTAPFRQLQGVGNYLCVREIAEAIELRALTGTAWTAVAVAVRALHVSPNGVWDDVTDNLTRRSSRSYSIARSSLSTTAATCERGSCEWSDQCPMMRRLEGIDKKPGIIATNHALVATWLAEAEPRAPAGLFDKAPTALVLDEAHNLEDSMASAWAKEVGAQSLRRIITWLWRGRGPVPQARQLAGHVGADRGIYQSLAEYRKGLPEVLDALGLAAEVFLHEYGGSAATVTLMPFQRTWPEFRGLSAQLVRTAAALESLRKMLQVASIQLGETLEADPSLANARYRRSTVGKAHRRVDRLIGGVADDLDKMIATLRFIANIDQPHQWVHVLSGGERSADGDRGEPPKVRDTWTFEGTPIEIGDRFAECIVDRSHSIVLTSATLQVSDSFDFLAGRLSLRLPGEEPASRVFRTEVLRSPFDYDRQSALVLTSHLPVPTPVNEREFVEEVAADQVGFLSLSHGRAMTLFAARVRMEAVADLVDTKATELAERGVSLLVQHREAPSEIRRKFRADPGTAVFGLRSYWEGFDAPGETLSYLFIEKPPYPHPGEPLSAARQRVIQDRGGDPFTDYVVPRTAITLAQGFGRLIRTETDRGVAYIYDRRITQPRSANETLLSAIPTNNVHYAVDRDDAWRFGLGLITGEEPDLADAIVLIANTTAAVLEELRLLAGEDPTEKLAKAAKAIFGIDQLHDSQLALMRAVLDGRDALGFLPTGRGKSLCFQLPALLHPDQLPFVVVSPLVALIKDQVDELRARRGLRAIVGITGRTTVAERTENLRDLADGKVRVLYLSPERLVRDPTLQSALSQTELGALVVDEAHCISSWGHDFRPEFRQIAPAVKQFRRSPRMGLTATATPEVEDDITVTLGMNEPVVVREPTDRPDLAYWTHRCGSDRERTRELLRFVAAQGGTPGIVYASRRALTEELAWVLRQSGNPARSYHAGMVPEQREAVQDDYLAGNVNIIVATKAFGMGINKADIAWIVHYDLPDSLESYAQEAGRAARAAGLTGTAVLFWRPGDIGRRRRHLSQETGFTSLHNAQALLGALVAAPRRGGDSVIEPDALADHLKIDEDELNVLVSWLEHSGSLQRKPDCTLRGHVTLGRLEPPDVDERREFVRMTKQVMGCVLGARRMVDIEDTAMDARMSPDDLEELLTRWSLERFVTFQGTRRAWRVEVHQPAVDATRFDAVVRQWRELQRDRLDAIAGYAESPVCRRVLIARQFGDTQKPCQNGEALLCDVCSRSAPPWHSVPLDRVADPESFVDVPLVVLQSVAWMSRNTTRPFGEATMKAVVVGVEQVGGFPISPAALKCPQFGALRHVRGNEQRYSDALEGLLNAGLVERFEVESGERTWTSIRVTDAGRAEVTGCG